MKKLLYLTILSFVFVLGSSTAFADIKASYQWPLLYTASGNGMVISGKIDTSKYSDIANIKIKFEVTNYLKEFTDSNVGSVGKIYTVAIDSSGAYSATTSVLQPDAKYYLRQVITTADEKTVLDSKIETNPFTPKGLMLVGSADAKSDFESRSYRLLAPWPGLSVLMDPSLCAEQKTAGKLDANAICDINGLLNYMFKLLVGLTAVVLVLRLIYEGYQLIVTDIPFLRASAKSKFFEALGGLLLALSAYLLLNTINPKLVTNDINIASVEVGVDEYAKIDPAVYHEITGQEIKAPADYAKMADTISQQEGIDPCVVKATIAIESVWRPDIIGCDENTRQDIKSRNAFINSGIKLDGTNFNERNITAKVFNSCPKKIDSTKSGYGLDWRFSKGGGLMQITKFPDGYGSDSWYEGVKEGGKYWLIRERPFAGFEAIINPEENIKAGIVLLKKGLQKCGGDVTGAFKLYHAGLRSSCDNQSPFVVDSASKKMAQYNLCKSNPSKYGTGI